MDDKKSRFVFQKYAYDSKTAELQFFYQLILGEEVWNFVEKVQFQKPFVNLPETVLVPFLQSMHLALGISYWKLYCPKDIEITSFSLSEEQAKFWNTFYTKGLGEFFYKNNIDFRGLVAFPYSTKKNKGQPVKFQRTKRSLLPIGGGKDGIVATELLNQQGKDFSLLVIYTGSGTTRAQEDVTKEIGKETLIIRRFFDKKLFELNKRSDSYNGHVPMVGMHAFISLFAACVYDYAYVVQANEESANYGNVQYLGESINHQWSKSLEFETLFQHYAKKYVTKDILYFSLLRAFTEIKITQIFSHYPKYFSSFVSCNKGFAMDKKGQTSWCGKCAKCAFVFALLAAFLSKEEVVAIFQKNLFEDVFLLPLYKELLGIEKFKPFECVGTPEEVQLAFSLAHNKKEWDTNPVMQFFITNVLPNMQDPKGLEKALFSIHTNLVPEEFRKAMTV